MEAEISRRSGPELIFSIVGLFNHQSLIVQTAITGSVLSNILLVLGTCFLVGQWTRDAESFPLDITRQNSQMLIIALASLVVPAAFVSWSDGESSML